MRSELCKTCIHTKICCHDKNLVGDVYVAPHPLLGSDYADKAWKRYQEWKAAGFPCEDYIDKCVLEKRKGKWIIHFDDIWPEETTQECSLCHAEQRVEGLNDDEFCPNCGADMRSQDA